MTLGEKLQLLRRSRGLSQEQLAAELTDVLDRYKDELRPAIILIPGREGSIGLGQSALRAAVERAVGTNILGD